MSKPQHGDLEAGTAAAAAEPAGFSSMAFPAAVGVAAKKVVAEEEDPRLRWAFVRKVYCILALQFVVTAGVAAAACLVSAVPRFFLHGPSAERWTVFLIIVGSPFVVLRPMLKHRERYPANLLLLVLFTLCCSLSIAVSASTSVGIVVLQATILTAAAVISLTLFTFWTANKGYDFRFWPPFVSTSLSVLLVYITIQIFLPLGRVDMTICGFIATLVFSAFIILDTHMLLKRHTYNEYIVATITLYLDVINLFMAPGSLL